MPQTNVYRGSDANIILSPSTPAEGPEGEASNTVIEGYELSPVGRATGIEIRVMTDLEEFHEIGRRHAAQLRPGNIHISGSMKRAYINGALLSLQLGKGADPARVAEPYVQPSFNLQVLLNDPAFPTLSSTLTVHGVKMENWAYCLPEDDFVMEEVTFRGLFITVEDVAGE